VSASARARALSAAVATRDAVIRMCGFVAISDISSDIVASVAPCIDDIPGIEFIAVESFDD
jgi:hypothetical protein